jgi:sulfite reductase (NADPH) flavoprotein alpha-component
MEFWYFGYGSNMDLNSLRAKGVEPRISERAVLRGWRLRFNVQHFFRHEGGVANIEPSNHPSDAVWGVLHDCENAQLALLDATEAHGHCYDRTEIVAHTDRGEQRALAYVGVPSFLDERCRPTRRYLNILLRGATAARLDPGYVEALRRYPVHEPTPVPPFVPPVGHYPTFTAATLGQHPLLTALFGAVFDMSRARFQHSFLHGWFGGKDMTLFHLKRLDDSDGHETLDDIKHGRLRPAQQQYLNEYLHEYSKEYVYVGRYIYD